MKVIKRNRTSEPVQFDKILTRISKLADGLESVDATIVAQKTISGVHDGVHTTDLDRLAAETAAYMSTEHPNYGNLAARIELSNLAKQTPKAFVDCARRSNLHTDVLTFIEAHADELERLIHHDRDDQYDYFGFRTLEKSYLRRDMATRDIVERPQYMHMRIACGIHYAYPDAMERIAETYDALSRGTVTHATPTMFNSGTPYPQMASCFLMRIPDDSIDGIFRAVTWCANISKHAGGIGVDVSNVRANGSTIRGSGGQSNGLVPMLQVFDRVARYVDQGGGKRKGAIAIYIEPWHADIFDVLDMKKNHGAEETKARDLFYGLWMPDLFMRRVESDGDWTLLCPDQCKDLCEVHGAAFEARYEEYVATGLGVRTIKARDLWASILDAQIETGTPYMLYKDACNAKSNHQHLGTLRCSNLCTEILEYVSDDEVAVCNLASIALPKCVVGETTFDHDALVVATRLLVRNLNRVIDGSFYPIEEARRSNLRHRPIGIGVQGLADVFQMMNIAFDSEDARALNADIFETIYYAALSESVRLAAVSGAYESYEGSPLSEGRLQPDLWDVAPRSTRHDWVTLRADLSRYGARNSLLVAPMPTASTAQILGNTECFEPITSNMFTRRVLAGEFPVVNRRLVKTLVDLGVWNSATRQTIIRDNGSVQNVEGLSDHLKSVYRTVWEMSMRGIIEMAADRGAYIDQSQSLNLFLDSPTHAKLTSMHLLAWKRGLKTGQYYLRSRAGTDAAKISVCAVGCTSCSA